MPEDHMPDVNNQEHGALSGVRVLDLTTVFMGPLATQQLADLGADVIKIEAPGGDSTRALGPGGELGLGALFVALNRNKRSIALDLKKPEGRQALLQLARDADVLVYNVRPAAMERLGLGYEDLVAVNPRLLYVGLVGFSQSGRYAPQAAFDDLIQAASGLSDVVARGNGSIPRYLPMAIVDRLVGLYAFGIISAALYAVQKTGRGRRIEVPMFETMLSQVLGDHLYGHSFVPPRGSFGYPRLLSRERRPYATKDGHICCTVYTDANWKSFLRLIGKPSLYDTDPRFANIAARTAAIDELYALVAQALLERTTSEWVEALRAVDIPCFPMHTLESVLHDPHLGDIHFFQEAEQPGLGTVVQMRGPTEWSEGGPTIRKAAPALGEDTRQVLLEAGLTAAQIDQMIDRGVAVSHPGGTPSNLELKR
jgi:crotonobetainyl-CoA:carnitine CoA-transferase CaiB-like acyl-CoA transferase